MLGLGQFAELAVGGMLVGRKQANVGLYDLVNKARPRSRGASNGLPLWAFKRDPRRSSGVENRIRPYGSPFTKGKRGNGLKFGGR
jgi:hypothetical protein